jgi:hypothetical protein
VSALNLGEELGEVLLLKTASKNLDTNLMEPK